jgi:hypothetical protein
MHGRNGQQEKNPPSPSVHTVHGHILLVVSRDSCRTHQRDQLVLLDHCLGPEFLRQPSPSAGLCGHPPTLCIHTSNRRQLATTPPCAGAGPTSVAWGAEHRVRKARGWRLPTNSMAEHAGDLGVETVTVSLNHAACTRLRGRDAGQQGCCRAELPKRPWQTDTAGGGTRSEACVCSAVRVSLSAEPPFSKG